LKARFSEISSSEISLAEISLSAAQLEESPDVSGPARFSIGFAGDELILVNQDFIWTRN
jgi:hypothetical protein